MSVRWLFIPISLLFCLPRLSIAGNGKITGRVVAPDESGIRATIVLQEGERGVASDSAGHFCLLDVVPGTYDVRASAVGFHPKTVTGVHVSADETADLFIQLVPGEITLPEVLVEERAPVIEKTRTSAKTTFDAEEGEGLPVPDVTALISTAPGVYGPFIRGAHQYDSRVYVDGVDVTDRSATWLAERIGFTNASFLENTMHAAKAGTQAFLYPSAFSVEQATVYAGMAGADYGSAPGVVTYALKEGRGAWHGSLQFRMSQLGGLKHAGPSVYNDASAYYAARDAFARNSDPAIRRKAAYFTWTPEKYRYGGDPTYNFDFGMGGRITEWAGAYVGGGWSDVRGRLPNERTRQANATVKLTLPIATGLRVNLLGILQDRGRLFGWKNQAYDDTYRFFLEGVPRWDGLSTTASIRLSHFLSASMFYELQVSYSHDNNRRGFCDDNGDGIVSPSEDGDYITWSDPSQVRRYLGGPNSNNPALFFSTKGDVSADYKTGAALTYRLARPVFLYEDYTHRTLNVRGTLNSQILPEHQLSLGGEIRRHWIKKLQRTTNPSMYAGSTFYYEEWSRSPLEFSGFVQDRLESGGLIATMGIRLDAFNFDAADLRDYFAPIQLVTDATGLTTQRPVRGSNVPFKMYVSPRLGVSHPVSDRAVLYFSLARTVSPLPYSILYYNYGSWLTSVTSRIDQEPLSATSYDIGGQIRVHDGFTGSL